MSTWKPKVELDPEDPYKDRKSGTGNRLMLNSREREIVQREMQYKHVIEQLQTTEKSIDDILGEIDLERIPLTRAVTENAYPPLRQAFIQVAVRMFLRFDEGVTRSEIGEHLSMSEDQLKKLTKSDDFIDAYNEYFLELRSHPVIKAVQSKIVEDLLPQAYQVFDQILRDKRAPASVRLKAAMEVMDKSGVKAVDPEVSNRRELADFLGKNEVNINTVNVNIPEEFRDYQEKIDQRVQAAILEDADDHPDQPHNDDIEDAEWTEKQSEALPPHTAHNI